MSPSGGDPDGGVSEAVARAVKVVRESGLPNSTNAMFTNIEGESWDEVMDVVKRAVEAVSDIGATPSIRAASGGLDANWMVRHGIPTVTFGAGQNEPHTLDEWINLDEYDRACTLAVRLATQR